MSDADVEDVGALTDQIERVGHGPVPAAVPATVAEAVGRDVHHAHEVGARPVPRRGAQGQRRQGRGYGWDGRGQARRAHVLVRIRSTISMAGPASPSLDAWPAMVNYSLPRAAA